jgi:hypothetical protein
MNGIHGTWRPLVAAIVLAVSGPALAQAFDVAAGPSTTSGTRATSAVFASVFGQPPRDDHGHFAPVATIGWIAGRHTHEDHLNRDEWLAGGGVRYTFADPHWFASEQIVATSARNDALSSRFEFMTSAGWQDGHFIVMVRHVSNGHLIGGGRNIGETMLLAGVAL